MTTFRLSAWDLNTNTLLTDLSSPRDLQYNDRINDAGEFSFRLSLTDPLTVDQTKVILGLGDNPFKVLVTANDNERILYAGIGWKSALSKSSDFLSIDGKALSDYFRMLVVPKSYTTSISPVTLLQNVVADVQAQTNCNLGIGTRVAGSATPANIVPNYPQSQHCTVAQVLTDITAAITPGTGGVDYYMEHTWASPGVPRHTMVISSPRAGRTAATSPFFLDLATVMDWTRDTDNTASGNHIYVVGQGSGGVQPVAEGWAQIPIGGLGQPPRLEQLLQYSHVSDMNHLRNLANGNVQLYGRPVTVMTVQIRADYDSMVLGSYGIGDDAHVWSEKSVLPAFPNGLDEWWRVIAYRVDFGNDGTPKVTLTLNRPPVF